MTGPQRAVLYRLAAESGLRAGELSTLKVKSFDLDSGTVAVQAAYSKRRRQDILKITLPKTWTFCAENNVFQRTLTDRKQDKIRITKQLKNHRYRAEKAVFRPPTLIN